MNEEVDGLRVKGLIHHLALAGEWDRTSLDYRGSTLGRTLAEERSVHCSATWQVQGIADAVYRGRSDVVLLTIDPGRLEAEVRTEDGYPHI